MDTDKKTLTLADKSERKASIVAGIGLLIMIISAPFSFIVLFKLIVLGDAATTVNNIMINEILFRSAIVCFLIVIMCDVVVAWGLYILLKSVNKNLALLAGYFRMVHAIIFAISLIFLLIVLNLLSDDKYLTVFDPNYLYALVLSFGNAFNYGYLIGQAFFAIHLIVLGYLIFKSGNISKILGVLLIIGGFFGYLIDSFSKLFFPEYLAMAYLGLAIGTIAEILLCILLLFKGGKTKD